MVCNVCSVALGSIICDVYDSVLGCFVACLNSLWLHGRRLEAVSAFCVIQNNKICGNQMAMVASCRGLGTASVPGWHEYLI